jgi:flagellar motility protein MotE (MotC chaperone)
MRILNMNIISRSILFAATSAIIAASCTFLHAAGSPEKDNYSSVEERRLQHQVTQERANVRKEQVEIILKKKELKTLEGVVDKKLAEIENKLAELRKLQDKLKLLLTEKSAEEKKRVKNLASIYARMTPEKASLALSGLDQQLAADLLASMKVKAAAKILDQTSKNKTTQLSTTFSTILLE